MTRRMPHRREDRPLTGLLDAVRRAARRDKVSLREVFAELGDRTFTPVILVICVLLVSPLSGIPGVPTVAAVLIVILSVQALAGRRKIWLPPFFLNVKLGAGVVKRSVDWLRRPALWLDRKSTPRLRYLTEGPMRLLVLAQCAVIPLAWPALEVLPGATSFGAATLALFAFGLLARDGLFILAGYVAMLSVPLVSFILLRGVAA